MPGWSIPGKEASSARWLLDVIPGESVFDLSYRFVVNSVEPGYLPLTVAFFPEQAYNTDFFVGELGPSALLTVRPSPFPASSNHLVVGVLPVGSDVEMYYPDTGRVVAMVEDAQPLRNWSEREQPQYPGDSVGLVLVAYLAVPLLVPCSLPDPAPVYLVNSAEDTFDCRGGVSHAR